MKLAYKKVTHENLANHSDYEQDVKKCGSRHGIYIRQWRDDIWFCEMCGHRVKVEIEIYEKVNVE